MLEDARVITIQSAMLVALGLLSAGFLVLLLLPLYRRRTERLQLQEIKRSLPMSEAEIRADKDRLRAEYAIRIHQLETRVDESRHLGARQHIELNRRDGKINTLEAEIAALRAGVDEHENARRVLEQTITDRLPKLEQRLVDARQLLADRDSEIERLSAIAEETATALDEARQINLQQREELMRTSASLTTRAARKRDSSSGAAFDAEVALRAELEALRSRNREQAQLISSLQAKLTRGEGVAGKVNGAAAGYAPNDANRSADLRYEAEISKLRSSLLEAEESLRAARSNANVDEISQKSLEKERSALKTRVEELEAEVLRQKASLLTYEAADRSDVAGKESKVAMKARLNALESATQSQGVTIQSLRAELAAANERMARQAAQFREELRRIGAGTVPVSTEPRVVKQPVMRRPSLAERMSAPKPVEVLGNGVDAEQSRRVSGFLKALSGGNAPREDGDSAVEALQSVAAKSSADAMPAGEPTREAGAEPRRSSLLDRISHAAKPLSSKS
ncbi:MAG: hypothetical protein KDJ37_08265 [Hyphomicrobiaceae bacterium]|nr:hypothetical protein [Hyphomicrobiaceae bacterium]